MSSGRSLRTRPRAEPRTAASPRAERGVELLARLIYCAAWWLATPLVVAYLLLRSLRQPAYRRHWRERWSLVPARSGQHRYIWVHAVSVGETRAAQPLVEALLASDPTLRVLLTHMTPTGRETGAELFLGRYGDRVVQAYLPYDYGFAMRRFLRVWRPLLGILLETEVWPNLCQAARRNRVPIALINARLSRRSLRAGLRWRMLTMPALRSLACVVAQSPTDARRIARLGRDDAVIAGNLKFDVEPPGRLLDLGMRWKADSARPVVLAASTRDGEEALLLEAWRRRFPPRGDSPEPGGGCALRPLLVVVPRHPQRFAQVRGVMQASGLRVLARSGCADLAVGEGARDCDLVLGDSMGEMFAWYAMADVAIIGGSLLPYGAQNLIEACASGTPVVLGPSTFNFEEAARQALAAGAARRVADAESAVAAALTWVDDPSARTEAARRASRFALRHRGATRRTLAALGSLLSAGRG